MPGKPVTRATSRLPTSMPSSRALVAHHGPQLAAEQPPLDVAALLRRVTGSVGHDGAGCQRIAILEAPARVAVDQLGRLARGGEVDRPPSGEHRLGQDVARLGQRALAHAEGDVDERRVPQDDRLLGSRRAVVVDRGEGQADQPFGERPRVGDGRRGQHELRLGAVGRAQPAQPAHDLGDVRAEHATVDVGLVEHDEAQVVQELGPVFVTGQDADVHHVGVRHEDGRGGADARALSPGRVTVVEGGDHARQAQTGEAASLVLGERLGGVDEERPAVGVAGEVVERWQRERERLAAGGAGGDDHVATGAQQVPDASLVAEQLGDAAAGEGGGQGRRQVGGQRCDPRRSRGAVRDVDDLLVRAVGQKRQIGHGPIL